MAQREQRVGGGGKVAAATEKRRTADNGLNAHSSRSHLVVVYALCGPTGERQGQMALVDLAGSERLARTAAAEMGERRDEAVSINKSLSALGDVLHASWARRSTCRIATRSSRRCCSRAYAAAAALL